MYVYLCLWKLSETRNTRLQLAQRLLRLNSNYSWALLLILIGLQSFLHQLIHLLQVGLHSDFKLNFIGWQQRVVLVSFKPNT